MSVLRFNVAACDRLPMVLIMGQNEEQIAELGTKLSPVIWDDALQGMFIYTSNSDKDQVATVKGLDNIPGFAIVQPDTFGQTGAVLAQFEADTSAEELKAAMIELAETHERPVIDHRNHVRKGLQTGTTWETEIPVEDKDSLRAIERSQRGRRGR